MKKKMRWGCGIGVLALLAGGICIIVVGFVGVSLGEYKNLPRQVSEFNFGATVPEDYVYSPDQIAAIDEAGLPQNFYILFYHEEDSQGKQVETRFEEWLYPIKGMSLIFENGVLILDKKIPITSAVQTPYEPKSFTAFMKREQIASAAGIKDWFILPVESELVPDADLYFAEGLTFGLQNDDLVYIEALGFDNP